MIVSRLLFSFILRLLLLFLYLCLLITTLILGLIDLYGQSFCLDGNFICGCLGGGLLTLNTMQGIKHDLFQLLNLGLLSVNVLLQLVVALTLLFNLLQ